MSAGRENEKRALRAAIREQRHRSSADERAEASAALTRHLVGLADGTRTVAAYLSTPEEPDTRPFLHWAREQGIRVLLPVSGDDGLLDWAAYDSASETVDARGMPAPASTLLGPAAIATADLVVVPASCVDRTGMRMGWGRGYFDRALGSMQRRAPVYAVIFERELLERVPSEAHDQRVDGVVTPSGVTRFADVS